MARRSLERIAVLLLLLPTLPVETSGRDSSSRRIVSVVGISGRPAYTLPTNKYFRGIGAEEKPVGATFSGHLTYGFRFSPETVYGKLYPNAVQGIGVGFNTFFNPSEIGNPLAVYMFQISRIASPAKRLFLDYEWNFGISSLWKKYDPETNPDNVVVGSKINAYIYLGLLLNWKLDSNLNLKAGVGVSHFSNGNTSYPNAGVNTAGGSLGLAWDFGGGRFGRNEGKAVSFSPYVNYDLVFYGATRKKGFLWENGTAIVVPGSFGIAGMNFSPMYNFSKYLRAGLSLDAQFDESANIVDHIANTDVPASDVKFHRPPFREQFAVGVSARAEIVMPVFSINVGVGRNILCMGSDTDSFYQVFVLKTNVTRNLFIHIGYQLFKFKNPNNLMLGLGWRFNARGHR